MRALYIGIYSEGTTSKMRADMLGELLGSNGEYRVIDTDIPFIKASRIWRSVGFRYKKGPLIKSINNFILSQLGTGTYDLVWIDKAIYLSGKTTRQIKEQAKKLVHYTPDAQFFANRSRHFFDSIATYDWLITTKSFEKNSYLEWVDGGRLIVTTQGYDSKVHRPLHPFEQKKDRVAFIGLCEPHREEVMQALIDAGIPVVVGGVGWTAFIRKNEKNDHLQYAGDDLRNDEYSGLISESYFSIGLLSKRFPELHTTRTLEIPACGTALLSEKNEETGSFFTSDEAIFYADTADLIKKITYYRSQTAELKRISENGLRKVSAGGFSYRQILKKAVDRILSP